MQYTNLIDKKIQYITHKLLCIRKLQNLNTNIDLFKTFCMLYIRMGAVSISKLSNSDRQEYIRFTKVKLKTFCMIPPTCPNALIKLIIRDIGAIIP